jgi:hypothetical protein
MKKNKPKKQYICPNQHVSKDYYMRKYKENPIAYPYYWLKPISCECGKGLRPISV